ncbi:copper amine oxidase N-terminal domain-containing protein [Cohnella lubricantis]|uniref:Copper amine oxidase N-terminal domain-containing protein n=1 Tax=Cohnella lubricantis TaxID=2163172 RepID=A0A841TEY3_9BACL|nr:copper amine oxidase N-terminal domain-containing protein [Cohnella lubricantis]MBB6678539.1 copper amine oxidase N-terminal domain-containing protein [Cohnella lubricantis]MBP2119152.1 hypothetical protein [Cohnella lubricantis]
MKKAIPAIMLALSLAVSSAPAYAADNQIKIDGVSVASDVKPEVRDNRTMVPLRVISEILGAKVHWSKPEVTVTKGDMTVILKLSSAAAEKNGEIVQLDVKPYLKHNRVIVPLRFVAEAFGCKVNYSDSTVTVNTPPLVIGGVQVKALQEEFHMTMGGVVQQVKANAFNESIYDIIVENEGAEVDAPASYSWMVNLDVPGSYYKDVQYDFLDAQGNSIQRYDIYSLVNAFPADALSGYPTDLIYDGTEDQWHLFSESAREEIRQLLDTAHENGLVTIISDTVV